MEGIACWNLQRNEMESATVAILLSTAFLILERLIDVRQLVFTDLTGAHLGYLPERDTDLSFMSGGVTCPSPFQTLTLRSIMDLSTLTTTARHSLSSTMLRAVSHVPCTQ